MAWILKSLSPCRAPLSSYFQPLFANFPPRRCGLSTVTDSHLGISEEAHRGSPYENDEKFPKSRNKQGLSCVYKAESGPAADC